MPDPPEKDPAAVERGRLGGEAGTGEAKRNRKSFRGKARAAKAGKAGGIIGGAAGTGASKRRSPEHYRAMVEARRKQRAEKAKGKEGPE